MIEGDNNCTGCGQPMLPQGETKRLNEYDHARGCPFASETVKRAEQEVLRRAREFARLQAKHRRGPDHTAIERAKKHLLEAAIRLGQSP